MTKQVDYKVYNVVNRKDKKDFWNRLGGAFEFKTEDGRKGITIPAMNMVLLEPKDEPNTSSEQEPKDEPNTSSEQEPKGLTLEESIIF